ncbi:MAG: Stealth CR1 domain-containing protein [Pseudoclavibacter sp.]
MEKIDFVVTWVDETDKNWLNKKNRYLGEQNNNHPMNSEKAYRDWGLFKYWFRSVEKYAPWVNKIYLVTDHQKPKWLNLENRKLKLIDHKDILPSKALPVFNSNAIESCIYKIKNLSEHFVVFNDDMFLNNLTKPSDFFKNDLASDILAFSPIIAEVGGTANFQVNDMEIINKYFKRDNIVKSTKLFSFNYGLDNLRTIFQLPSKFVCGFYEPHLPMSLTKTTFKTIWKLETQVLSETSESRFRNKNNINIWLFRYWQLAEGKFSPRNSKKFGKLLTVNDSRDLLYKVLFKKNCKVVCLNDDFNIVNFDSKKEYISNEFKKKFPDKSNFEI